MRAMVRIAEELATEQMRVTLSLSTCAYCLSQAAILVGNPNLNEKDCHWKRKRPNDKSYGSGQGKRNNEHLNQSA